tara:strand:+ start:1539 stop:2282 length:744 start_codon:yes stop_codon:yes gene_type:complete
MSDIIGNTIPPSSNLNNMDKSIDYLLSNYSVNITFTDCIIIIGLSLIVGFYLRFLFCKFTNTFSSKISFGNTILIVTISVASLIAIVKSSLALSLGLVGALSVVRFRTAIKEPYNLAFLLLSICSGISIGASQYKFTLTLIIISSFAIFYLYKDRNSKSKNRFTASLEDMDTLAIKLPSDASIKLITNSLEGNVSYFKIISLDVYENNEINIILKISIVNPNDLLKIQKTIKKEYPSSSFNFYSSPS